MEEIGKLLREARLQKGVSFEDICNAIRVQEKYLVAIEKGDRSVFSAELYYKIFMKSYASFLGLNVDELTQKYEESKKELNEKSSNGASAINIANMPDAYKDEKSFFIKERFVQKIRSAQNVKKIFIIGGIFLIIVIAIVSLLLFSTGKKGNSIDENYGNENALIESYDSENVIKTESASNAAASLPKQAQNIQVLQSSLSSSTIPFQNVAVAVGEGNQILTIGNSLPDSELWVRVDSDGKLAFEGNLAKAEQKTFRANDMFRVRVGYAKALRVVFNGRQIDAQNGAQPDGTNTIVLRRE
ncbi:MAG: DUF4115 domain-containing protein [Elusimicrobiota bacterium]|jgi:cytoskeletal protein RodZ|nr:DUF4115 domain-containing protein [Elusimicrobiota bacterium]